MSLLLKYFSLFYLFFCFSTKVIGQNTWTLNEDDTFELNRSALTDKLKSVSKNQSNPISIQFPDNNGEISLFEVYDNSLLPESLAIKYPNIHAYKGKHTEHPELSITFTCTPTGISASLFKGTQVWSLQKNEETNTYYIVDDTDALSARIFCETKDDSELSNNQLTTSNTAAKTLVGDNTLRILRTAIIVTGGYSQFFIDKAGVSNSSEAVQKAAVLSGIVTSFNNLNTVFERDLGIRFELIENNDELIFLDEDIDPFTSDDANTLINTGNEQINNIIGLDNYDIGHVLSSGFAGLAQVGALCGTRKAEGVSGSNLPEGTSFDFTLLAHELGHQLGATHTQNYSCERSNATAVEPGSGSTIMGYAGIFCVDASYEVQTTSDEYFHLVSIDQIKSHVQSVSCGIESIEVVNNLPVIEQLPNYVIPANTNFILEAPTTDADNDPLTYSWEQLDNEVGPIPLVSTSTEGPLFRSLQPTTTPSRNFPKEYDINTQWEVLPTVSRDMNFGLTVRDGNPGGIVTSNLTVTTVAFDSDLNNDGEIDRFEITAPLGQEFPQNFITEIQWNVAGTDSNGINTENVSIELSYDGGITFPVILFESTPNDGAERILIPKGTSSTRARIKITPINNIYYTISQIDFSINDEVLDDLAPVPNPVEDTIFIQVFKLQVPKYEFDLYDMNGRLLISKILESDPSVTQIIPVDVSGLNDGIYIMKLVVGTQIHTRKIIKN